MSDTEPMTRALITAEKAGEILGLSAKTVLRRTETGEIKPAVERGNGRPKYLYDAETIIAMARSEFEGRMAKAIPSTAAA